MAGRSLDAPRRAIPVFRGGYLHYRRVFSNIISGAVVVVIIKFVPWLQPTFRSPICTAAIKMGRRSRGKENMQQPSRCPKSTESTCVVHIVSTVSSVISLKWISLAAAENISGPGTPTGAISAYSTQITMCNREARRAFRFSLGFLSSAISCVPKFRSGGWDSSASSCRRWWIAAKRGGAAFERESAFRMPFLNK